MCEHRVQGFEGSSGQNDRRNHDRNISNPGTLDPSDPRTLILIFKPNPVPYLYLLVFSERDIEADEVSIHLFIGVGV